MGIGRRQASEEAGIVMPKPLETLGKILLAMLHVFLVVWILGIVGVQTWQEGVMQEGMEQFGLHFDTGGTDG